MTNRRVEGQTRVTHANEEAKSEHSDDVERGQTLVLRRTSITREEELDQRKSLFCTSCKHKGKCCHVIINSGSTNYLVSEEMVTKLKLKREKHPHPYQLS